MQRKGRGFFNLETTLEYAVKEFSTGNPDNIARKGAVEYNSSENEFNVQFLQNNYTVNYPSAEVLTSNGDKASVYISILILHYLNTADGTPLSGRWISFKELPGGQIYIDPFKKRAIAPFLKAFGDSPEQFIQAASKIGGINNAPGGTYSMIIPVLPRVPLSFIIHEGDDEFPSSANILFDAHAHCYLPTEDYAHLPGVIIRELTRSL